MLDAAAAGELARTVVEAGAVYGHTRHCGAGQRVNLEFVSANPTGPLHLGGTRWAAVGDSLARILQAHGAEVAREYYFNDHGAQIDRFAAVAAGARPGASRRPEDGYGGAYIGDIAARVVADAPGRQPDPRTLPEAEAQEVFRAAGVDLMFGEIKADAARLRRRLRRLLPRERPARRPGRSSDAVARLRELGHIYEPDGAVWLRTTDFGDDKDRVVIKSDGEAAYFAGDLAYYLNKRERGFDRCVIMLGADHHGYIGRLMAMCAALRRHPAASTSRS